MRKAGIREARKNLSVLIDEVKNGQEIVIADRGKPVEHLVPIRPQLAEGFPYLSAFRCKMPIIDPPVSHAVLDEREEGDY